MRIEYRTRLLRQCAQDEKLAKKMLGAMIAKMLYLRLSSITAAENFDDLRAMPGKFHELTGDRKGQWAASLDANYRLVLEPMHEVIYSDDGSGRIDWAKSTIAVILEIVDYH